MARGLLNQCYTMGAMDVFVTFNAKEIQPLPDVLRAKPFAVKVFRQCMAMVMMDVIENDIVFRIPRTNTKIYMRPITGEDFINSRKHGGFLDVDYLKSNFTGYRPCMEYISSKNKAYKPIYVGSKLKLINEKASAGFVYKQSIEKWPKDYFDLIAVDYPHIPKSYITRILTFGWNAFSGLISLGADFHFRSGSTPRIKILFGSLPMNLIKRAEYTFKKLQTRALLSYLRKKIPHNGYCYGALTLKEYDDYINGGEYGRPLFLKGKYIYKFYDYCSLLNHAATHIVRFKYDPGNLTKRFWEDLTIENPEIQTRRSLTLEDIKIKNNEYEWL